MDYRLNIPKGREEELGRLFRQGFTPRRFIQRALNQFFKGIALTLIGLMFLIILAQITAITGGDTKPIMGMIEKILYGLFIMFFKLLEIIAEVARYVVDFVFRGLV